MNKHTARPGGRVKPETAERLHAYMVDRARFRDRLYFAADATAARDLGVCRKTITRARQKLEADGRIVRSPRRIGRAVAYEFPLGARRKPRGVPQRSLSRTSRANNPRYARVGASRQSYGRRRQWRIIMGDIVPLFDSDAVEKRVTPGQALYAAVVDELSADGLRMTSSIIARVVKTGKAALADGVEPEMVLTGCLLALKRGAPHLADSIINDVVLAKAGAKLSRTEYESMMQTISRSNRPGVQRFREAAAKFDGQTQLGGGNDGTR